jgi:hypothetical protein
MIGDLFLDSPAKGFRPDKQPQGNRSPVGKEVRRVASDPELIG